MGFDIDPRDKHKRILAVHQESDSYFECKSLAEFEHYCQFEPLDDVTGIKHHEDAFIEQERLKKQGS